MRIREKLTLEEKFSLALELIKRERSLDEIQRHYRVSHTTAYKIRKTFLDGGRAALEAERRRRSGRDLEERVAALEDRLRTTRDGHYGNGENRRQRHAAAIGGDSGVAAGVSEK